MGLAASQARFLAITARKADLEFRSLEVAQNKLSITQSLADITDQYQKAMNSTKLIWSNTDDLGGLNDFTYASLMYPSALNNYNAYILSDRANRVVLDNKYANIVASIISPDGKPDSSKMTPEYFQKFIDALGEKGALSKISVKTITDKLNATNWTTWNNTENHSNNDEPKTIYSKWSGYGGSSVLINPLSEVGLAGVKIQEQKLSDVKLAEYNIDMSGCEIRQNGNILQGELSNDTSSGAAGKLTFMDLFTSNLTYSYTWSATQSNNTSINDFINGNITPTAHNALCYSSIKNLLTWIARAFCGLGSSDTVDSDNNPSVKLAYQKTMQMFFNTTTPATGLDETSFVTSSSTDKNRAAQTADYNARAYNRACITTCDYGTTMSVSLSNLVKSFLTYYENISTGSANEYNVSALAQDSIYTADNRTYVYDSENSDQVLAMCQCDFYMQLFNNICINGWTSSEAVSESKSLEQLVKNGTYFVSSLAPDNYYYQTRYNEIDYVVEVKDEDAITQAEVEYEKQKAKLTFKEDKLDMEMKNLDAEIAELTTEYQSVQNLISKNVEKTFSYFQS